MVFEDYLPFHVDNGDAKINIIWQLKYQNPI